jgi:MFS family permease
MTRTLARGTPTTITPEDRTSDAHSRNLVLLWAGQFVNTAGLMMLVPIMPFYLEEMGTQGVAETQTWAGVAIAAPALALTVATPMWGRVGDHVGRKWMVVRALLGLAVAMVVMAAAATPLVLVAGRLLQGCLGGVVEAAAAFAGSAGSDKKRGSSLGKSFSATAAGALAGPIAGGLFVGAGGLRQLMLVIAAAAAVLAVGCAAGLREPQRVTSRGTAEPDTRRGGAMQVPAAVPLALAAVGAYFGVYGLIPIFAEHVSGIGVAPESASVWVGVLHSVMWGATLLGSFWWGKHNDATQRPLCSLALAAGGCAVSIAAVVLPLSPLALIPVRLLQGFFFAALAQSLFLHFTKHAPEERRSSFVGMANSFLLIGQSAGPLLAGPLVGVMPVTAAIMVMAAACGLACLLALGPARAEKHSSTEDEHDELPPEQEETAPLSAVPVRRPEITGEAAGGVEVRPIDAWRLMPERLRDLPDRHATPWAPARGAPADPGAAARITDEWKRRGVLIREPQPALYAYEQAGPHGFQRGLICAVHLDSRLLAHEDVIPARASAMAEFMHASNMNLAPALLGYSGDGRTTEHLRRAVRDAPLAETFTADGQKHRLWRLGEAHVLADIAAELRTRAAFIADGHHRYTAARQLRRQRYASGYGPGPWDFLPAVLVDVHDSPLRLAPIHRVLPHMDPRTALSSANGFRIVPLRGALEEWLDVLKAHADRNPSFIVVTRTEAFLLTDPDPRLLGHVLGRKPKSLRQTHVAVLEGLIDTVWNVPRSGTHLCFEPSAMQAVRRVREQGGIAVLLRPPHQQDLDATVAAGMRLPPKTTSFAPKPHPGLLLRAWGTSGH